MKHTLGDLPRQLRAEEVYRSDACASVTSLAEAIRHVERVRDLSIRTRPLRALGDTSVCGLLLVEGQRCTIFHAPASSAIHRLQCLLHELGHLLLRHDLSTQSAPTLNRFLPDVRLEVGDRLFGRADLSDGDEIEAERLADLLAAGIRRRPQHPIGLEEFLG
ncbi:hypothetical protein [Plantibacter sp. 2H11-2]|uniref:hypothetical protein n=1 Tax=Plantibacter sp. 2H11-2 TaxID=3414431 RepID=UPI003CF51085